MAGEWMSGGDSFNGDASPLNKDVFMELAAPAMVGDRCRRVGKKRDYLNSYPTVSQRRLFAINSEMSASQKCCYCSLLSWQ